MGKSLQFDEAARRAPSHDELLHQIEVIYP
jgi:hypothetical protein